MDSEFRDWLLVRLLQLLGDEYERRMDQQKEALEAEEGPSDWAVIPEAGGRNIFDVALQPEITFSPPEDETQPMEIKKVRYERHPMFENLYRKVGD